MALIAARIALIELESKDASRAVGRRAGMIAAASTCLFFAWALILVAAVSLASRWIGWPWDMTAAGLAGLHLLVGWLLIKSAKPSAEPTFPATRAEFQKDREWIENFNNDKKSSD